jgi:hypothetical protein
MSAYAFILVRRKATYSMERKTNLTKWHWLTFHRLPGRLAVVIGANNGIGWHTALELAQARK